MSLEGFFLRRDRGRAYREARSFEAARAALPASRVAMQVNDALRCLEGPEPLTLGTLPDGRTVTAGLQHLVAGALVIGATGSGKTRFLLGLLTELIDRFIGLEGSSLELEVVDPKYETYDLMRMAIAAIWLRAGDETREKLASFVQVIDWTRERVTPFAPFERPNDVSDAYMARLRTDIVVQAGGQTYTEQMRQGLFMLFRLLIAKGYPLNYPFVSRLFRDEGYRRRVLEDVSDLDVRTFFSDLERNLTVQTREALLRRILEDLSFPEVRCSEGIPPESLRRLLPKRDTCITLGNYSSRMSLPASKAIERANQRIVDVLLRAPRRDPDVPGLLVIEEAPTLLTRSSDLVEPLMSATRTVRSAGLGIIYAAQDFSNALPGQLVRSLALNARWMAVFQSREDAELLAPHVLNDGRRSDAERKREFLREVQSLPRQDFYFHLKGLPVLRLRSRDVPSFPNEDELREVFEREIASRAMITSATAVRLIEEWEAEVVGTEPASRPLAKKGGIRAFIEDIGRPKP